MIWADRFAVGIAILTFLSFLWIERPHSYDADCAALAKQKIWTGFCDNLAKKRAATRTQSPTPAPTQTPILDAALASSYDRGPKEPTSPGQGPASPVLIAIIFGGICWIVLRTLDFMFRGLR